MDRKNETMTLQGYSSTAKKPINQEQPFSDKNNTKTYGMPITAPAFLRMLYNFRDDDVSGGPVFKDLWWVEFSKASIFRILAQEDCEFIRFYFAIPDLQTKKASLLLSGVDGKGNTIKKDIYEEVAKKMADPIFNQNNQRDEDAILESLSKLAPASEEKGNGGSGGPFLGENNVHSIEGFLQWLKDNNKSFLDMDLSAFAKDFLTYADTH